MHASIAGGRGRGGTGPAYATSCGCRPRRIEGLDGFSQHCGGRHGMRFALSVGGCVG